MPQTRQSARTLLPYSKKKLMAIAEKPGTFRHCNDFGAVKTDAAVPPKTETAVFKHFQS
jgi:hypothetical protein